jgi:thiol-disulfide isomerase/thioredoxin
VNKGIIIGLLATVVILSIGFFLINSPKSLNPSQQQNEATNNNSGEVKMVDGYTGQVLAGEKAPFLVFNRQDYEKALNEKKIIVLDFYANWCPECRVEAPELDAGFNALDTDQVIGFRVNFNDPETDQDEKDLAAQFKIPYQHTKVILRDGVEVFRTTDLLTRDILFLVT